MIRRPPRSTQSRSSAASDVYKRQELCVRSDGPWLREHHAAFHLFLLRAAQQNSHVVARVRVVQQLAEHFDVGGDRLAGVLQADDFDFFHLLENAALHTTGYDCAATFNVEHVFNAHQERLVHFAHWIGHKAVSYTHLRAHETRHDL